MATTVSMNIVVTYDEVLTQEQVQDLYASLYAQLQDSPERPDPIETTFDIETDEDSPDVFTA